MNKIKSKVTEKYLNFLLDLYNSKTFDMPQKVKDHGVNVLLETILRNKGKVVKVSKGVFKWEGVKPDYRTVASLRRGIQSMKRVSNAKKTPKKSKPTKKRTVKYSKSVSPKTETTATNVNEQFCIEYLKNSGNYEIYKVEKTLVS